MSRLWSGLHTIRLYLSRDNSSLRRQKLSSFWDAVRHPQTLIVVLKGSPGLRVFALGIGSSAAAFAFAFANANHNRADLPVLKPYLGRSAVSGIDGGAQDMVILELTSVLPAAAVTVDQTLLQECGFKNLTAVVRARATEDVVKVVNIARAHKIPLISQYAPEATVFDVPGGILLDLSCMKRVLHIHEDDGDIVCQAAASWEDLKFKLEENDIPLALPFDTSNNATIGKIIGAARAVANNNWLLNVTAVLPNGTVIKTQRRARRSGSGLDTTQLFVGTEGTVGIITEVTLRLVPLIPTQIGVAQFDDAASAIFAALEVLRSPQGCHIRWVKFVDDNAMSFFNFTSHLHLKPLPSRNTLLFKFEGSEPVLREVKAATTSVVKRYSGGTSLLDLSSEELATTWQNVVHLAPLPGYDHVREASISVPVSHLPDLIHNAKQYFANAGLTSGFVGDIKDGNFRCVIRYSDEKDSCDVNDAIVGLVHRALALDGSCTGQNGIGLDTKDYLAEELGHDTVELMRTIKAAVDPHNIMNPHKTIFPTES